MQYADLKTQSTTELRTILACEREALARLREKAAQGALKEVRTIPVKRRTIARIESLLSAAKQSEITSA